MAVLLLLPKSLAITPKIPSKHIPRKPTNLGTVVAVLDQEISLTELTMHKEPWVGAVNLPEDLVKQLCQMFNASNADQMNILFLLALL